MEEALCDIEQRFTTRREVVPEAGVESRGGESASGSGDPQEAGSGGLLGAPQGNNQWEKAPQSFL